MNRHRRISAILGGSLLLGGCHATSRDGGETQVAGQVQSRFGYDAHPPTACGVNEVIYPGGLSEAQPLTADHAVLLALWNNPTFHDNLAELQLTRADLIQADLLPNPEVVYFFHTTDKPLKYLVDFPIEAIWLRPFRLKIAAAENARSRERLTQLAFDLIRDTRQAFIDVSLARDRVAVAEKALTVRGRIAELAEARLKAGDASAQEVTTARVDALQAAQDATRIRFEIPLAEERLKNLMGVPKITGAIPVANPPMVPHPPVSVEALVDDAIFHRPDGLAALHAREAAEERLRFSKLGWVRLLGIADATSGKKTGHEFGPGLRVTLPIFNQNQGGISRAEAELEQLTRRELVLRNQIITDVRLAAVRYEQARSEYANLAAKVRPEVEAGIQRSQKAYEDGNAGYLIVLETTRQLIDTNNREAQLKADLQRAWAELERSVGRRVAFRDIPIQSMSYQKGLLTGLVVSAVVGAAVWFLASGVGGPGGKASPPAVPATVAKTLDESKINTVILKPEGLKSLGIETGVIGKDVRKRTRIYGGEVTVRPGQAISVAAPLSGVLKAPEKGVPAAGTPVAKNQPIFQFLPLLTPEGRANLAASRIDADGQVKTFQTMLDAAKVNLERAKQLLKDEAGSKRMLEDAQAVYDTAVQSLSAVTARRDLLAKIVGEFDAGTASPLSINAPEDGLLRTLSASPGQTVPGGALLFDLVNTDRVWIRVPVYAGDLSHLDPKADAVVTPLAARPGHAEQTAKSVPAAPSANPLAGTVDLFYELENRESKYSPGHRVAVRLTLDDPDDSLTVPWDAVLHDIHGGTWVYEQLGEATFARRRVEVRYVTGNIACLKPASAPKPGTVVVTKGAAELFGAEAGFSK